MPNPTLPIFVETLPDGFRAFWVDATGERAYCHRTNTLRHMESFFVLEQIPTDSVVWCDMSTHEPYPLCWIPEHVR